MSELIGKKPEKPTREKIDQLATGLTSIAPFFSPQELDILSRATAVLQESAHRFPTSLARPTQPRHLWIFGRNKKEIFEREALLGNEPSCISGTKWRVFHPKYDPAISYREDGHCFVLDFGHILRIFKDDQRTESNPTDIIIQKYIDSQKIDRILFDVGKYTPYQSSYNQQTYYSWESYGQYLARLDSDGEVDASVVAYQNPEIGKTVYIRIRFSGNKKHLECTDMMRVKTS